MPRQRCWAKPVPIEHCEGNIDIGGAVSSRALPLKVAEGGGAAVKVKVGDALVNIVVDEERGPLVMHPDGSMRPLLLRPLVDRPIWSIAGRKWHEMTSTEREVAVHMAARWNCRAGAGVAREGEAEIEEPVIDEEAERARQEAEEAQKRSQRCSREMARPPVLWMPVGLEAVLANHMRRAPGMLYGLEFPWSEATLSEMGPEWLTAAFHAAGTLEPENAVTRLILEPSVKVTGGNNGGKFLFEVRYKHPRPQLHTKLFAKVPFPCGGPTKSDRLSSSVYKQPMDLVELNAYRLLEARFPMPTPKFYFGDISNETTNFILITERVAFMEVGDALGKRKRLRPYEIEGPYEKCKDFQLRSDARDYYLLLFRMSAKLAGWCKAGRIAPEEVLDASFNKPRASAATPEAWGMRPDAATGEDPTQLQKKIEVALDFVRTARVVFPIYATSEDFAQKFREAILLVNGYRAEIDYWRHSDPDYVSLAHTNLNSDNAYFWRGADGELDCGVFDWGGLSRSPLGHKLWWCINCADFDSTTAQLDVYLEAFIAAYAEHGGPLLNSEVLRLQIFLTALENMQFMVAAVPNCHQMCPLKEWASISDRHDPRIAANVDGKSTLRTTLHVLSHGIRVLQEANAGDLLQSWVEDVWGKQWGQSVKPLSVVGLA